MTEAWDRKKVYDSLSSAGPDLRPEIVGKYLDDVVAALMDRFDVAEPIPTKDLGEEIIWQLRSGKSLTAAARFAAKFYPSRPEAELRVESVGELLKVFTDSFGWKLPGRNDRWHPAAVRKKTKPGQPDTHLVESFSLEKLRLSLATATKGMLASAKWRPSSDGLAPSDRDNRFIAVVMAAVLERVEGQTTVTSGQLSTACLDVLTQVHPLCAVRYALTAKGLRSVEQILSEVDDIARKESQCDSEALMATWNERDSAGVADRISAELTRGRQNDGS